MIILKKQPYHYLAYWLFLLVIFLTVGDSILHDPDFYANNDQRSSRVFGAFGLVLTTGVPLIFMPLNYIFYAKTIKIDLDGELLFIGKKAQSLTDYDEVTVTAENSDLFPTSLSFNSRRLMKVYNPPAFFALQEPDKSLALLEAYNGITLIRRN